MRTAYVVIVIVTVNVISLMLEMYTNMPNLLEEQKKEAQQHIQVHIRHFQTIYVSVK